jgi:hypothetical protein
MTDTQKRFLELSIETLIALGCTREDILKELGINDLHAEMKRVDAVSENKAKISL